MTYHMQCRNQTLTPAAAAERINGSRRALRSASSAHCDSKGGLPPPKPVGRYASDGFVIEGDAALVGPDAVHVIRPRPDKRWR